VEEIASMKQVLTIGFDPAVVDFSKWPGLTPEKIYAAIEAEKARLMQLGYHATSCLVDRGETAESAVAEALSMGRYDCVLIGAGVRKSEEHFLLFEKLINLIHRDAPNACICFNTNPSDTAAAIQRWI
jgi:hypothetical protein